jgi:hypothetical protein
MMMVIVLVIVLVIEIYAARGKGFVTVIAGNLGLRNLP